MTEQDNINTLMAMMESQQILHRNYDQLRFTPMFAAILESSFKQHPGMPAHGLTYAVMSFCPETSKTERALLAGGVMTILRLIGNMMYHEIKAQMDRDVPATYLKEISFEKIIREINEEKKLK